MKLQPESKLAYILDSIDFSVVVDSLESKSNKGPSGYNIESILRAFLVQQIENIPNKAALVRRLKQDPVMRYVCGFHVAGRTPSEATMSRYYNKISDDDSLERLFYQLVDQAIDSDIIETNTLAIDATKLESYERAKPKKKVDKDDYSTPDWGAKYDTHRNKITWFGWKIHLVSDSKGELPLDFTVTPANEADCEEALPLVSRVTKRLKSRRYQIPEYWTMDSGYDYEKIYKSIYFDYNAQAIIPLNKRNAKQPPAGFYDFDGTPSCSCGYKMVYWGKDNNCNKFRCPHVLGKEECLYGSAWCSDSNYGYVVKTRVKDNPRYISLPHRGSRNWQKIYNKRTSVERTFSRLKEHLNLENLTVMGANKVKTHVLLSCISLIAGKLAIERLNSKEDLAAA